MTTPNVSTEVLRTLHRIHRQLADLRERLGHGPKRIRAAEANVEYRERQLAEFEADAKTARMACDAKQVQLKAGEGKIEQWKLKLQAAASNREYQALKDQIAAQEMTDSVLEDEILEGMEKVDEVQQKIAETQENLAKAREKLKRVADEVEQGGPVIQGDLARLEGELKECEAVLPADIKDLYDRVVRQKGEEALAAIEDQYCGGCNQHVPLNVIADIMLGRPMFCRACGRMLYMPEGSSPEQHSTTT